MDCSQRALEHSSWCWWIYQSKEWQVVNGDLVPAISYPLATFLLISVLQFWISASSSIWSTSFSSFYFSESLWLWTCWMFYSVLFFFALATDLLKRMVSPVLSFQYYTSCPYNQQSSALLECLVRPLAVVHSQSSSSVNYHRTSRALCLYTVLKSHPVASWCVVVAVLLLYSTTAEYGVIQEQWTPD